MGSSSDAWLAQSGGSTSSHSSSNAWLSQFGGSSGGSGGGFVHNAPSHSGGGFLSGIEGAIGSVVNPPAHVLGNAAGQAAGIIHGIPNSAVTIAEAIKYDFGKGGTESLSQAWHDPHGLIGGVAKPQVEAVHQDASALRRGDWHYFQQHPLNPVLDAATLLSIGGKGALLGAKTGALGTRAAALAKDERVLHLNDHAETLRQAKTLQGRIRQNVFDRYSEAHPDQPLVGVNVRMKKILTARAATQTLRAGLPVRAFQRITGKLSPAEVFAFHVGAEGVPLEDRIAYYQAQLAGASKAARPLQQYLNNLESPAVHDVLTNPRPEFVQALSEGKQLEARAGERLVSAGSLSEETRVERAGLPQRVMFGTGHSEEDLNRMALDAFEAHQKATGAEPRTGLVTTKVGQTEEGLPTTEFVQTKPIIYPDGRHQTSGFLPFASVVRDGDRAYITGLNIPPELQRHRGLVKDLSEQILYHLRSNDYHELILDPGGMSEAGISVWRSMARRIEQGRLPGWSVKGKLTVGSKNGGYLFGLHDTYKVSGQTFIHDQRALRALQDTKAQMESVDSLSAVREPSLGANLVHPDFPAPFRFPHVGKRGNAGLFTTPKTASMLGKAAPLQQLRHNAAVRLRNALLLTDPERVLTTDFLQTMRHETVIQMQREAMDPISQDLSAGLAETGFKKTGEWYYRPSYDRKTTAPIPRHVREAEMLTHDQMILNKDMARTSAEKAGQGIVSEDLRGLGIDARDVHNLERLKELGVRRVPAAFGKDFAKEFGGTHWALRYFYDRPLDVWRAITLNYRPAWAVNNFVGNAIMGLATYGPEGAANYLRVLLSTERGDDKVLRLRNYTMRIPRLRRKYGKVFDEVAPQLHSAGLYGTQTRITHPGVYEGKLAGFTANKAVRALGFAPKKVGRGVLAVGRGVTKVEILLAEDTSREAAFITEAGGDLAKIRSVARKMGEGNVTLAEALKRLDRPSVEKAVRGVSDALGDFNDLSHFERSVVRRLIPFYSWFKVITKVSGKYVARYPARVLLLKNIADAQNAAGEPKLPEWLRGAVLLGGQQGGTQALLSTQGVNPYETLNQVATGGAGSVLSPFATAGIVGLTGRDPSFGTQQDYYGPGHNTRGGWLGQLEQGGGAFLSGLAPARVYSQTTGPYQGKLYAPKTYGHVGPVTINDFLLQYLGIPIRHVKVNEAKRESGLK